MLNIQIQLIEPFQNLGLQTIKFNDMHTQKSLVIAKPCHENWGKMSPTEKGRFCDSCTKEVVDFRDKKKEDIIEYLENYKGEGQTCGQFLPSQIDKVGKTYINSTIYKRISISFLAFLGVFSIKNANAQQKMGKVAIKGDVSYKEYNQSHQKIDVTVFGSVRNLAGDKISGAEIKFNHEGKQLAITKTNANGTFALQLKVDKNMKAIAMYTTANGYERKINIIPEPQKDRIKIDVVLDSELMLLGEIAIETDTVYTDTIKTCSNVIIEDTTTKSTIITEVDSLSIEPILPVNTNNDSTEVEHKIDLIDDKNWLRIYPNPSSQNAVIEWKDTDENKLEIFDLNGKLVWSTRLKGNKTVFNTSDLSNGVYLVKITSISTGKSESTQLHVVH